MNWVKALTIFWFLGNVECKLHKNGSEAVLAGPFLGLTNELIDETLKWVKVKYLCGYDPLELPPVTQDDLNVTYSLTISDIRIDGLSHLLRLEDVEVEKYERHDSNGTELVSSYALSSTLGIRNVALKFRIEMLKILSLTVVDFVANGSIPEIDIPMLALVAPAQRRIQFDSIGIENLDKLEIDIKSGNFLTSIGGSIPSVQTYIKNQIKDSIKDNLESRIGDAKTYLNNAVNSVTSFETSNRCAADKFNSTSIRLPSTSASVPLFFLALGHELPGLAKTFSVVVKYRSKVIGSIPLPPGQDEETSETKRLYGHFDPDRNEFVLNLNGVPYKHVSENKVDPSWPLTSNRERDIFCLYAQDDSTSDKIKLNPYITRVAE